MILKQSLWDLKHQRQIKTQRGYYFEAVPMGFETLLFEFVYLCCLILKQSLWDLKRALTFSHHAPLLDFEAVPMGFETTLELGQETMQGLF